MNSIDMPALLISKLKEHLIVLGFGLINTAPLDRGEFIVDQGLTSLAENIQIPIREIGRLRGLFEKIEVNVYAGIDVFNEAAEIKLVYHWQYINGEFNGHHVNYIHESNQWNRSIPT